ncbi:GNAT family N-acetyltransferase [soil metagenome]
MPNSDGADVEDNPEAGRFELVVDGHLAELTYERTADRLVLIHTGVPEDLEGQGLGGRLVRAAIGVAARDDLTVVPKCPFARRWLERHPDEVGEVSIEPPPPG